MSELPHEASLSDPQALIDFYGSGAEVVVGKGRGMITSLGEALKAEEMFCEAPDAIRDDPIRRAKYIADMLSRAGSLDPTHQYLLEPKAE
jgi:hypothetical protein